VIDEFGEVGERGAAPFQPARRRWRRLVVRHVAVTLGKGAKARTVSLSWRVSKAGHYGVGVRVANGSAPTLRALGVPSAR